MLRPTPDQKRFARREVIAVAFKGSSCMGQLTTERSCVVCHPAQFHGTDEQSLTLFED